MILPLAQRQLPTKPVKSTPDIFSNLYTREDLVKTGKLFSGLSESDHTSGIVT